MKTVRASILVLFLVGGFSSAGLKSARGVDDGPRMLKPPRARTCTVYQRRALQGLLESGVPTVDSIELLVVRVSFSDRDFQATHDSLYFANEIRHLDEYFAGASRNSFTIRSDLYADVVLLQRPEGYYGKDGHWNERVVEMLMEVVEATDQAIDFSSYNAFAVIHAGAGQETDFNGDSPGQLWSGFVDPEEMAEILADTTGTPGVPTGDTIAGDTVYVDNLMVWPEDASQDGMIFGSLGVYAYQIGLRIGMVPLFDTTPSGFPDSQGIGAFGLLGYGLYNAAGFIPAFPCAFHRYLMGWVEPVEVSEEGVIRITDINTGDQGDTTLVRIPISATEYFLVTNRVHDTDFDGTFDFLDVGSDDPIPENEDTLRGAEFDFFLTSSTNPVEYVEGPGGTTVKKTITGSGLMVWHVDETVIADKLASGGRPQDDPALKGVDLEEADGIQDLDRPGGTHAFGSYYDSFREGDYARFGVETTPSSANNAGVRTGIVIEDISAPAPVMTFEVRFQRPFDHVRTDVAGSVADLSPIPVDLDGVDGEELVVPAHGGPLYVVSAAGQEGWDGRVDTLAYAAGETWTGSPVFADLTGDGSSEIFVTSKSCSLYACTASGAPYPIDDDGTPGVVTIPGSLCSAPMACEVDGDPLSEVILLAQEEETIWLCIVGCSIDLPGTDWHAVSPGVAALRLADGHIASHPCRGSARSDEGFFFVVHLNGEYIAFFVRFFSNGSTPTSITTDEGVILTYYTEVAALPYLLTIAAGDVDGNGSDEVVCTLPGIGVAYFTPYNGIRFKSLRGMRPSPPVLVDVDRDGVLETVVRDEGALYVFTGYGTLLNGWPVVLPAAVVSDEQSDPPPPSVVGDIDGDGDSEILFAAGGDLYAYEANGTTVDGWPLPGEGDGSGSPALLAGAGDGLYIFSASSPVRVQGASITGPTSGSSRTSLVRYRIGVSNTAVQSWSFHRRDAGGSGRQEPSSPSGAALFLVDEKSFICYPNPANTGLVTVRLTITGTAEVHIRILTVEGEAVVDRDREHRWSTGNSVPFEEEISTDAMVSGVYICQVEVRGEGRSWSGARMFAVVR